jgi:hypothetical protein
VLKLFNKIQYDAVTYNTKAAEESVSCATFPPHHGVLKQAKVAGRRGVGLLALREGVACDAGNSSQ